MNFAKRTLEEILALIPVEATIAASRGEGRINLRIQGDRSGLLIGRKGKTLDALQFLVNKIVSKALDKKIDVVIDSENYRRRSEDSLTQMALKMGDKAKRIKKPVTTNPMNPHDRRLVHLALKDDEHLETRSRGEGLLKRVVIIPKGKGPSRIRSRIHALTSCICGEFENPQALRLVPCTGFSLCSSMRPTKIPLLP